MVSKVSEAMFSLKPSPGTEKQQKSCGDNFHRPVQVFLPHFPTSQIKDPHSQGVLPVFLLQLRNFITHTLNFILEHNNAIFSGTPEKDLLHILGTKEKGFTWIGRDRTGYHFLSSKTRTSPVFSHKLNYSFYYKFNKKLD